MGDSKKSAWDSYRWWAIFKWLIAPILICFVIFPKAGPVLIPLLILCLFVSLPTWFSCPRCNQPFFSKLIIGPFGYYNVFASKCLNCGLPKWEEPPPNPLPAETDSPLRMGPTRKPHPRGW